MSLIDTSYFVRDINVPLSSNSTLNTIYTNSILRYEDEVLKKLLGYPLWKEFTDAVAADAIGSGNEGYVALADKWVALRDGADIEFQWNDLTISEHWNGLINSDKISLIAYYVYYMHRINHASEYTGIGEMVSISENSKQVSPREKLVNAHSNMLELYGRIPSWIRKNYSFVDSSYYVHYYPNPSAYNFLLANVDDYPTWRFTPIGNVNSFDL